MGRDTNNNLGEGIPFSFYGQCDILIDFDSIFHAPVATHFRLRPWNDLGNRFPSFFNGNTLMMLFNFSKEGQAFCLKFCNGHGFHNGNFK